MDDLDHRRLGQSLELYHIQENAPGMVFWHPRGYAVYRVLEDYIRSHMRRMGFKEVRTPQLLPRELWEKSGHWDKFRSNMFCAEDGDGREFALKPMSCPCHLQIFNQGRKSYRDLPVRYAEFGACHRNEPSGSMHGLMRTRAFEQDDAHVICRKEDVQREVARFIGLLDRVYSDLGFEGYEVALSTRPASCAGSDDLWDLAEAQLAAAAAERGIECRLQPGEGAFYGPKLEFVLRDRQGRDWQCGTVQLDMVLPGRLGASYIDENDEPAVPIMIHHAVLGSMGRFLAMLLEHHGGDLPFWLSPDQVAVVPISQVQAAYAERIHAALCDAGVRAVLYDMNDTLSRKLVEVHAARIPVAYVVGGREAEAGTVAVRERDGSQRLLSLEDAVRDAASRR
ncbi:threonine--tRNA ligase [Agrobacterium salinitolerans]|nr:threonine--tRNA ligase [Agrobacterium salinitolerans]